jgi:hypothetical protein
MRLNTSATGGPEPRMPLIAIRLAPNRRSPAIVSGKWLASRRVILRFVQISGAGKVWLLLFPRESPVSLVVYVGLRLVREGVNTRLPVAQVGGEFIGARLLTQSGLTAGAAMAMVSIIVDLLLQAATQVVFTLTGFTLLVLAGTSALYLSGSASSVFSGAAPWRFWVARTQASPNVGRKAIRPRPDH